MTQAKKVEIKKDELPEGWVASTLGDIASYIQRGKSPKYAEFSELPVVNQKCVRWHGVDREHVKYIHPDQFKKWEEKRFLQNGDLLWNSTGTGTIGRAAIVHLKEGEKLVADSHVTIVRSGEGIEPKYVHYWVMSPAVQNSIEAMQSGSTNQVELSKGAVESTPIPVAPSEQQKRIVAKIEELFSHIDAGIEALKKAKQLLKQYRQSVLKAAVTGELTKEWREANKAKLEPATQLLERILKERRQKWEEQQLEQFKAKGKMPKNDTWKEKYKEPEHPDVQDLPELANEWQYVRLDALAEIQGGLTVDSKRKKAKTKRLPYLRVANVQHGYLDLSEMKEIDVPEDRVEGLLLKDRDVLFNEGGDRDKLGRGWVWHDEVQPCTYQNHVFRARPYSTEIISEFISIFGNTFGQDYFMRQGKKTTNLASINKTKPSVFPVPLVSKNERDEVMAILDEKLIAINRVEKSVVEQLLKAEKNKQSILASAFSGKV